MKTPYELAIEAGAKRLAEVNYADEGFTYLGMAKEILAAMLPHAIPERCDDELYKAYLKGSTTPDGISRAFALLRTRMTPPAKPQTEWKAEITFRPPITPASETPKPPADDEQVEGVARAIWDQAHSLPWAKATEDTRIQYRIEARAAIAAMGGGKRWGVYNVTDGKFVPCWKGGPEFSTDKDLMLAAAELWPKYTHEVREYVEQAKGNTDKAVAEECLLGYSLPSEVYEMFCDRIVAAIEKARKGADCGSP